jgi:hypothetical protein
MPVVSSEASQAREAYRPQPFPAQFSQPYMPMPNNVSPNMPSIAPRARKKKNAPIFFGLGIGIVLVCIVAGLLWFLFVQGAPQLSIVGKPSPGQSIMLKGAHFPIGSKLGVVVDSNPLILFVHPATSAMISSSLLPLSQTKYDGAIYSVTVGLDGTFTLKLKIPGAWKTGSQYTILVQVIGDNPQKIQPVSYRLTIA